MVPPPVTSSQVNVHDAKTNFSKLLARVQAGEEVVIARAGRPVARLVRYESPTRAAFFGSLASKIDVPSDDVLAADTDDERLWGYR